MNLTGDAFNWDMLGSSTYVGGLTKGLPARNINRFTPVYRNIIVGRSRQFVKVNSIPESPLTSVLIENASIRSNRLFTAADVDGFILRNAPIETQDPVISLLDTRNPSFEKVIFKVPEGEVVTKVSGPLSANISLRIVHRPSPGYGKMRNGGKQ